MDRLSPKTLLLQAQESNETPNKSTNKSMELATQSVIHSALLSQSSLSPLLSIPSWDQTGGVSKGGLEVPLLEFVSSACIESRRVLEKRKATKGGWQTSTFHFVRLCRGRREFTGLSGPEFFNEVPWQATDFNEDEMLNAAVEWEKVITPADQDPMTLAVLFARELPVVVGGVFSQFKNYQFFLNVAFHLQRMAGDRDVYLPVELLARHLGVTPRIASNYRQLAKMQGYLKLMVKHTSRKATRYRVKLEMFPRLETQ
jgi:hypothetical protein